MLLRVSDLKKSYGGEEVLRGVTFQISRSEKVGLVGRNGAGKSTIFRIIDGEESPDSGDVSSISGLRIGFLDQHVDFSQAESVHTAALAAFARLHDIEAEMRDIEQEMAKREDEELLHRYADLQTDFEHNGGFEYTAKAEAILLGLGFSRETWEQDASKLSGGQKNRLGMVRLLLADADLLLLDEPTNHLDVKTVQWLEGYLTEYDGAVVAISHDRYFLDRTCSKIIEIDNGKAYSYEGNYSAFVKESALRREQQAREYENQQAFIAKTEAFISKNLAGQKTKQAKSRRNMLERMERVDRPDADLGGGNFRLSSVARTGSQVLKTEALAVGYGGPAVASGIDVLLLRGDRLGIIGGNGSGKTTFLKTILGDVRPADGEFQWGVKTKRRYYSQQLEELEPSNEVLQELRREAPLADNGELRSFLARFLFFGDDVFKRVRDLSGGEKGRLSLAKLIYSGANVLLLDEPTNHLDIPSREALEEALNEFEGTLIVVSHDRYFLDSIANRMLDFDSDGGPELFEGNYSEYLRYSKGVNSKPASGSESGGTAPGESASASEMASPRVLSKNERRRKEARIGEIEKEIPQLEEELKTISFEMSRPEFAIDASAFSALSDRFRETEEKISRTYAEWEGLLEELGTE